MTAVDPQQKLTNVRYEQSNQLPVFSRCRRSLNPHFMQTLLSGAGPGLPLAVSATFETIHPMPMGGTCAFIGTERIRLEAELRGAAFASAR